MFRLGWGIGDSQDENESRHMDHSVHKPVFFGDVKSGVCIVPVEKPEV